MTVYINFEDPDRKDVKFGENHTYQIGPGGTLIVSVRYPKTGDVAVAAVFSPSSWARVEGDIDQDGLIAQSGEE